MPNPPTPADQQSDDLIGLWVKLLPFQLGFLFLTGWTFNRHYFSGFGIDQRVLDLTFYADASQGLGLCLGDHTLLTTVCLIVALPLLVAIVGHFATIRAWAQHTTIAVLLFALTIFGWLHGGSIGDERSARDRSTGTFLPSVSYTSDGKHYTGRLLYIKSDTYFIHNQLSLDNEGVADEQLHVLKVPEITNVMIVEQVSR
jgi:hypothetical protein